MGGRYFEINRFYYDCCCYYKYKYIRVRACLPYINSILFRREKK